MMKRTLINTLLTIFYFLKPHFALPNQAALFSNTNEDWAGQDMNGKHFFSSELFHKSRSSGRIPRPRRYQMSHGNIKDSEYARHSSDEDSSESYESSSSSSDKNACRRGKFQSPININSCRVLGSDSTLLKFRNHFISRPEGLTIRNNGYKAIILFGNNTSPTPELKVTGIRGKYILDRAEYVWGQKLDKVVGHTINNVEYAVEFRMIHYHMRYSSYAKAVNRKNGVVIVVYVIEVLTGVQVPCMEGFMKALQAIIPFNSTAILPADTMLNMESTVVSHSGYYMYRGSTDERPCQETARWFISKNIGKMSLDQLEALQRLRRFDGRTILVNRRRQQQRMRRMIYC